MVKGRRAEGRGSRTYWDGMGPQETRTPTLGNAINAGKEKRKGRISASRWLVKHQAP